MKKVHTIPREIDSQTEPPAPTPDNIARLEIRGLVVLSPICALLLRFVSFFFKSHIESA